MKLYKVMVALFCLLVTFFVSGCRYISKTETDIGTKEIFNDKAEWRKMGEKIAALNEMPDMDRVVILVNNRAIIKKDVEFAKIYIECNGYNTLKERITTMIKKYVLCDEAERLGIIPSSDKINDYIEMIEDDLQGNKLESISEYIKGADLTIEEYLNISRQLAYTTYQIDALWEVKRAEIEDKILADAKETNISPIDMEKVYYEKYVEDLMETARIEYLDEDIKKIMLEK